MSKKRNRLAATASKTLGRRGSPAWRFNYFRSVILTKLLDDLYNLEETGIEDRHCRKIAASLNYFSNAATNIPSAGPFVGPLYKDIEKFADLYQSWNGVKGQGSEMTASRKELRLKMKAQRQVITNKARKLQVAIQENVDAELMKAGFDALSELITAVPALLGGVGKALNEFVKRGGIP
jgi:hypothetical protein